MVARTMIWISNIFTAMPYIRCGWGTNKYRWSNGNLQVAVANVVNKQNNDASFITLIGAYKWSTCYVGRTQTIVITEFGEWSASFQTKGPRFRYAIIAAIKHNIVIVENAIIMRFDESFSINVNQLCCRLHQSPLRRSF